MSYNYAGFVNALQTLLVATDANGQANLNNILPSIIDYAEQRIFRELDLLTTLVPLVSTTTANNRNLNVPSSAYVVQSVNFITPANTIPDNGTRNPVSRTSVEALNYFWPQTTTLGISPSIATLYALQNNNNSSVFSTASSTQTALLAPPPDSTYAVEFMCTVRPSPLSQNNPYTFLTVYLPDLFLAASMVFAAAYQRDFSSAGTIQPDDAGLAVNWESQYQKLKASASVEELRRKAASVDWTTFSPSSPDAQPR